MYPINNQIKVSMKKITPLLFLIFSVWGVVIINSCKKDPVIPTLTTSEVTNVTINSGTSGGVITDDGGAEITARGVCWSTSAVPTIADSHTTDNKGAGSFASNITGLTNNTLYHVRAYATNSAGTAYGDEVTFTSTPIVVATLTTTAVTSISLTTAVSGGNITADGNAAITAKGVCWATTTAPTISSSKTSDGTGTGSFTSNLSALLPNTKYYVRAYATNSAGTSYGNEVSFTTSPIAVPTLTTTAVTSITLTTAVSGGTITADGGGAITAKGVCWTTTANPTISNSFTVDGTGSGTFTSNLTGLLPATTYHVRAYATNSIGTAYGNDVTFTTSPIVVPTLTTTAATLITLTSAVSGGTITADGGGAITVRGVCWATTANPTVSNFKTTDGTGPGSFISNLSALLPGQVYHVRAYATNSAGTAYGNDITFTTSPIALPTLTTSAVTSITLTTAVSGGNITSNGGATVTLSGLCWSTTTNPTISDPHTSDGTATGSFASTMTGLLAATTYYVRAYATNSAGTAYGNEVSFTSGQIVLATLTTTAATSITVSTAVSGGNITANGGGAITARGVCWATTATPTISNFITTDGTGNGVFTSNLTALLPGTTYHVRAYATNSAGTAYGNEILFTTSTAVATLTTTAATSITQTTAVSGGNITSDNGAAITVRGVCWATTANPTITGSHTSDGTGTGTFTSNLTALLPGTTYHVRSYATNSAGTAYGNDISFTTSVAVATLTTTAATSITLTSASSGGNITSDGGGAVTVRGVCYSLVTNPTVADSHTSDGTGTGIFISSLSGLLPGTIYHVRAYATNSAGTAYGNNVSFTTGTPLVPTLTTTIVTSINLTTAVSGGNITSNGGATVTLSGLCWSTTTNPTFSDPHTSDGTATGSFASTMTGLTKGTMYYVRAYATNGSGTGYGNQFVFSTKIDDVDGNSYNTVPIGTQVWMAENLKTTLYNNSSVIPYVTASTGPGSWPLLTTPAYCWFNNDAITYKPLYGALYNWFAASAANLCPTGWHVPTDAEYSTMELTLGMSPAVINNLGFRGTDQGTQLKNTTGWSAGENGTNTSGFSGLPGGYRYGVDGTYQALGTWTYWWTSDIGNGTEAWYRRVDGSSTQVYRASVIYQGGKYVRCLKN
jgi:uncharacterized protein (TIGR02145 family)